MVTFSLSLMILLLFPPQTPPPVTGKLAYIHNGNVWIKTLPDGTARQVSQTGGAESPQWSPSGNWLVFRESQKTVLVHMAGEHIEIDGRDAAWAPSDDQLAFIDADGLKIVTPAEANLKKVSCSEIRLEWALQALRGVLTAAPLHCQ